MKINIKNFIVALAACCTVIWSACGDKATYDTAVIAPDGARVKFLHAISNQPTGVAAASQPFVVFANENKWTAVLNSVANGPDSIAYGGTFPAVDYSIFPAGSVNFKVKLPRSLNPDTTVLAAALDLKAGKYYTVMAVDTFPTAKLIAIEDDRTANKNQLKSYYRVINAVSGSPAGGYDIYMRRQSTTGAIATVKFGEASSFLEIDPNLSAVNDTIFVRPQGTTTVLGFLNLSTTGFTANRIRTLVLRGNVAVGGTRGVRAVSVSTILNN
jgi:Domain of unknown function (DUF4397)